MSTGVARSTRAKIGTITAREKATGKVIDRLELGVQRSAFSVERSAGPHAVGLGDLVATLAKPIAALIDTITERMLSAEHKTALSTCGACGRRHRKLNLLCPDLFTCPVLGELIKMLPASIARAVMAAAEKRAVKS